VIFVLLSWAALLISTSGTCCKSFSNIKAYCRPHTEILGCPNVCKRAVDLQSQNVARSAHHR